MGNLKNGEFDLSKLEYLEDDCIPNDEDFVKKGDFLFNTRNTLELVGKGATWFGESDKYAFNSNIARFVLKNINTFFYNYLYNTAHVQKQIRARATGTTSVAAIYPKSLDSIKYFVPSLDEQSKLARYFQILDNLITLHQRKPKLLCSSQNFYLVSEYAHPWEQRKLGDSIEDYIEKTTIEDQYPVLTSSQQRGIILQDEYFSGERVSQSGNIGYFVLPRGYFTYRSRSDNNVFVFNRNDSVDIGIISYFYPVFKPKDVDSNFLLRRLNVGLEKQLSINSEGTGQHVLSLKKFKNIVSLFPASSEEQQKIGGFFEYLDKIITLHQR